MKLRNKVLGIVGLIWVIFLTLTFIEAKHVLLDTFLKFKQHSLNQSAEQTNFYLINYIVFGIIFTLLTIWVLYIIVIKRIEKLNQDVSIISEKKHLAHRTDSSGDDEIATLSRHINLMAETIETSKYHHEYFLQDGNNQSQSEGTLLQREIAEQETIERKLNAHKEHLVRLAHYDGLTTLPNRVFFNEMLNKTINHASRHKKMVALLFINLDRFKKINSTLGHLAGDLVLKEIANRFSMVLRADDILARLGGDEFIVLLNDISHAKFASSVADKLLYVAAQPVKVNNRELYLTASIGICVYPNDGESLEILQKNADTALYYAKKSGGNGFQYFTREMDLCAHEYIIQEAALRNAIKNNEFVLYFQPKLNLADGVIHGVEALIRWRSPDHGIVNPAEFIPLAEETGLIIEIGEWALQEACRINKSWQEQGYLPISMAVNLSAKQFKIQDITQTVASALATSELAPEYLELEITETAVMEDIDSAVAKFFAIKQMGVHIAIDDFGSGYTSINYLKQFPINILKIDQTFIKGIPQNQDDLAITNAIIVLAHSLGMKVVAEGVETAEQLQYLADNNCDMVQGYYLSRPLPESEIIMQFRKVKEILST